MPPELKLKIRQRGLGLATAVFVLTTLALLGIFINRLVQSNSESTIEAIELIDAFYAAESGAQFGMSGLFPPDGLSGGTTYCAALATPVSFPFTTPGLNGCTANVQCDWLDVDVDSDGTFEQFYTLRSEGTCGGVTRIIQVRAQ